MADWIKMRCNLWTNPKVVTLSSRLSVTRVTVIGALHGAWSVADQHANGDGVVEMTAEALDSLVETPGLCAQLAAVGWLEIGEGSVQFLSYQEHNGTTAKSRASAQKRKQASRKSGTSVTVERDTSVTRGEERREEENVDSAPKAGRFKPPTVEEVATYCKERKNSIDAEYFVAYYETRDWKVKGGGKMKNWKTAVITWEKNPLSGSNGNGDSHGPAEAGDDYVG